MKKVLSHLTTVLGTLGILVSLSASPAQAAVVFTAYSGSALGLAIGFTMGSAMIVEGATDLGGPAQYVCQNCRHPERSFYSQAYGYLGGGIAILLLDADQSIPLDFIKQALADRYPFIDNEDSRTDLAKLIKVNFPKEINFSQSSTYPLMISEGSIRSALGGADLTEEQLHQIIADLAS